MAKRNIHGPGACNFRLPKLLRGSGCATKWPVQSEILNEAYIWANMGAAEDDFQSYLDSVAPKPDSPSPENTGSGEYN